MANSNQYPFLQNVQVQYSDDALNSLNPGTEYGGTETNAIYFEDREINGAMYRVQNATWNKFAQTWSLVNPALPAYGEVLLSTGVIQYLNSPAGTSPFSTWNVAASVSTANGNINGNFIGTIANTSGLIMPANTDMSGMSIFNVLHYGAKGDGVTDDTAAIQSAATALGTAGGGTLLLPRATYLVSAPIVRPAVPCVVSGQGMGQTIIRMSASIASGVYDNAAFFTYSGTPSKQHIFDLTLDMNGQNVPYANLPANFQFVWMPDSSVMQRVECVNRNSNNSKASNFGLFLAHNSNAILDCWFHNDALAVNTSGSISGTGSQLVTVASTAGMYNGQLLWVDAAGNPELVSVSSVNSGTTFTATYQRTHTGSVTIQGWNTNNDFLGGGSPSIPQRSTGLIVKGCRFELLQSDAYQRTNAYDVTLVGNYVLNCVQAGFMIQGGSGASISGNVLDAQALGFYPSNSLGGGILLNDAGGGSPADQFDTSISGNTIAGWNYGVLFTPSGGTTIRAVTITGNIFEQQGLDGIAVGTCNGVTVSGNTIHNCNALNITTQPGTNVVVGAIFLSSSCTNVTVTGNTCVDDRGTPQMQAGVSLYQPTNFVVADNVITGAAQGQAGAVYVGSGVTAPFRIQNNLGHNPRSSNVAPSFPASGTAITNNSGYEVSVNLGTGAGVTISQIAINTVLTGLTMAASSQMLFKLGPNEKVQFTYAGGTPSWVWISN